MSILFLQPAVRLHPWRTKWPVAELQRRGYVARHADQAVRATEDDILDAHVIVHATNQGLGLGDFVSFLKDWASTVTVQFDDAYMHWDDVLDPGQLPSYHMQLKEDIHRALKMADHVIGSTEAVLRSYRPWTNGEGWVIRNWLPEYILDLPAAPKSKPPMAGWFGKGNYRWRDFNFSKPRRFGVIGGWGDRDPWQPDKLWPHTFDEQELYGRLSTFTVGVAPLADTAWNQARSWIKPLEYAARGVPCVASPVGPYFELLEDGFPLTLAGPRAIASAIETYLAHPDMAEADGEAAREAVRERYTMESRGGDEWEAFVRMLG